MGLFSKKEEVPKLPPAPSLPKAPEKTEEDIKLPSIASAGDGFNRDMIKSAVNDSESSGEEEVITEEPPRNFHSQGSIPSMPTKPTNESHEPHQIFVKIDKFQNAKKSFDEIKKDFTGIEMAFGKMKDVKTKEDREIDELTSELLGIKSKLESIDSDVFDRV